MNMFTTDWWLTWSGVRSKTWFRFSTGWDETRETVAKWFSWSWDILLIQSNLLFSKKVMEVMSILIVVALNIILPTLDTFSDINLVYKLYRGAHECDQNYRNQSYYWKCLDDPEGFCSKDGNNRNVCGFSSHPRMATAMLIPFLLNYLVCFISFLRKEKKRKYTLIFALINLYPQFGMNKNYKRNNWNNNFQYFSGYQEHLPPG